VNDDREIYAEEYAVVINSGRNRRWKKQLLQYISDGGTILTEANIASEIFDIPVKKIYIKYLYGEGDKIFSGLPVCDIYKSCYVSKDSLHLKNQNGIATVYEYKKGNGKVFVFPSGFSSLMLNAEIKRKNFYSRFGVKETNERVSKISKGIIKRYIELVLEDLFHFRGLPFINLWYFPDGVENIFGFRIDTDFGTSDDMEKLYNVCRENNISASWFIETFSSEKKISIFKTFERQELGLHCYRHKIYSNYKNNFEDIKKGLDIFKSEGINPKGYAAPFGEWNKEIGQALSDLNFYYSSEFGYYYDSLPVYPYFNNSFSKVLQIPIHPISAGRLYWGGHSDDEMIKYFEDVILQKLKLNEPIILYTHPAEKRFHIFGSIFKKINELKIPNLSLNDYAEWWKKRDAINFDANYNNGEIKIEANKSDPSIWIKISHPNKDVYLSQLSTPLNLKENTRLSRVDLENNYHPDPQKLRRTTLRMRWHDILHKYRKMKQ